MCGVLGLILALAGGSVATQREQRAIFDLFVNEQSHGTTVLILRAGDILVPVRSLKDAGLRDFTGRREVIDLEEYVLLSSLAPAIAFTVNERALALRLIADASLFALTTLAVDNARPADLVYDRSPSAFVNYGLTWQPSNAPSAFLETALSLGAASVTSTFSWLGGAAPVRGLTTVTIDRRKQMQRWSAGDVVVASGSLDAGGIIAGLSVSREYDLDPYYRRYPSPTLTGTALTPSTVEVYVNDRLVRTESLSPGPFDVTRVPLTAGLGTTSIIVRDAFGREQEFGGLFYVPRSLLAPGTREYRYAVGAIRNPDVTRPASYGRLTAFAADRRGLTPWLTVGYRAEGDRSTFDGGPGVGVRLWRLGEVEGGVSVSRQGRHQGRAEHVAYSFTTRGLGVSVAAQTSTAGYATVADPPSGLATSQASAAVSLPVGSHLSLSLQYVHSLAGAVDSDVGTPNRRSSIGASWRPFGRIDIDATVSVARPAGVWQLHGTIGATMLVGPRAVARVAHERDAASATSLLELQQSAPVGTGLGYRVRSAHGADDTFHGELTYRSPVGEYHIARDTGAGSSGTSMTASGGLVVIGGGLFPTRAVAASFALVQVPGASGVRVYDNGHQVGRTDRSGNMLVPGLLAYRANRLTIADTDLPLDYVIENSGENIAPPFRGGAIARFVGRHFQTIVGRVTLRRDGVEQAAAYGALTIGAGDLARVSPIGVNGEFYFENLPPGPSPAELQFRSAICSFTVIVPPSRATFIDLGLLTCDAENLLEPRP